MMNPADQIIAKLEAYGSMVKMMGESKCMATCTAHDDRTPSLSVDLGADGCAVVHCHAGCDTADVLQPLGLDLRDLFPDRDENRTLTNGRRDGPPVQRSRSVKPKQDRPAPLPSEDQLRGWADRLQGDAGVLARLRKRRGWSPEAMAALGVGFDGARLVLKIRDRDGSLISIVRWTSRPKPGEPKYKALPGRDRDLFPAPESVPGDVVFVTEGEGDAIAATTLGLPATSVPGTNAAGSVDLERFRRFRAVYVLFDCDEQGRKAAAGFGARLAAAGIEGRVLDLDPSRDDKYDLSDFTRDASEDGGLEHARQLLYRMAADAEPMVSSGTEDASTARSWGPLSVRSLPAFPAGALPESVRRWVTETAEHTQTPADLAALVALGVLSGAALGGAFVDCGSWQEELGLYLLPAMPSGDRKSTVLRAATGPLRALEAERAERAAPLVRDLCNRAGILEARARSLTKQAATARDVNERAAAEADLAEVTAELDTIGEPAVPRLLADDATPEALAGLLSKHGAIAVLSAESAFFDNLSGRYSEGRANLHLVCKAYVGEPTTIDRKGHEPEKLERPLLAIALVVQPHVLEALTSNQTARAQGLVGRFAYALPETRLGERAINTPPVSPEAEEAWSSVVRRVAKSADRTDRNPQNPISVSSVSTFEGARITLSPIAAEILTGLQQRIEPRLAPGGDLHTIADWVARHHGRVARIAALLHLCEHPATKPISDATMRAAVQIGEYLFAHGVAVLAGVTPDIRAAVRWLEQRAAPTVSKRDLHRGPLGARGPAEGAERLADGLEALGILRAIPAVYGGRGRHPSPTYDVHPKLWENTA